MIKSEYTKLLLSLVKSIQFAILLGSLLISLSILISFGVIPLPKVFKWTDPATASKPAPTPYNSSVKVSVDDDPVLGDKNAPITMIEFFDYECPFCKRFFDQTLSQIKKNYIDAGKVKLVVKDLPIAMLHQNAHKEAEAANCARDQGGDTTYFKFHDEIFKRTTSNGTGLSLDQLPVIAKDLGINVQTFQQCLDSGKYISEIDQDISAANDAYVDGTPAFFIAKSTPNGIIETKILRGFNTYQTFQAIFDRLLK